MRNSGGGALSRRYGKGTKAAALVGARRLRGFGVLLLVLIVHIAAEDDGISGGGVFEEETHDADLVADSSVGSMD